jgi:hypothetical protein
MSLAAIIFGKKSIMPYWSFSRNASSMAQY